MYRDDDTARTDRAEALIEEIAQLERRKVEQAAAEQRLEAARLELRSLQATGGDDANRIEKSSSALVHIGVFALTATAAFASYTLLF